MKKNILKKTAKIILLISVFTLVGFRLYKTKSQSDQELAQMISYEQVVPVYITHAQTQAVEHVIEETGIFKSYREIDLVSETSGLVLELFVKTGDYVVKGQVMALIEQALVSQELKLAEMNLQNAKEDQRRFENLSAKDAVTIQQFEQVKLNCQNARNQVAIVKEQLENTIIRAPVHGYISSRSMDPGTYIYPGKPLLKISQQSHLLMESYVSESSIKRIEPGKQVLVFPSSGSTIPIEGVVYETAIQGSLSGRYRVCVKIPNQSMAIKPGMSGKIRFTYSEKEGGIILPRKCIISSLLDPCVYVASGDTVLKKNIGASLLNENQILVHSGLREDEKVIVTGHMNLSPGTQIRIIN
jgi:membrane fusion protein, multidrug efflux system